MNKRGITNTITSIGIYVYMIPSMALASVYNGPGVEDGINSAGTLTGSSGSVYETILNIIQRVLQLVGILAVAMIIAAGIYLLVGGGNDDSRDRARKILLYTFIGMLVILFANAYVNFLINEVP